MAGVREDLDGTPYGLHGESALLSWDATVQRREDAVSLHLQTDLLGSPFAIGGSVLPADEPTLAVEEAVTNEGGVAVPYIWQRHLALGPPLVGPDARLDVPADTGIVEEYAGSHENNRLAGASASRGRRRRPTAAPPEVPATRRDDSRPRRRHRSPGGPLRDRERGT